MCRQCKEDAHKIYCAFIFDECNWIQSGLITENMISLTKKVLDRINLGKHVSSIIGRVETNPDDNCITSCLIEEIDTTKKVPAKREEVRDEVELR